MTWSTCYAIYFLPQIQGRITISLQKGNRICWLVCDYNCIAAEVDHLSRLKKLFE